MSRSELLIKVIRDIVFLALGAGGIIYQQATGRVDVALLLAYLAMLGLPGAAGLLALRQPYMPGSPSPSPSLPSSGPSSPPSPGEGT